MLWASLPQSPLRPQEWLSAQGKGPDRLAPFSRSSDTSTEVPVARSGLIPKVLAMDGQESNLRHMPLSSLSKAEISRKGCTRLAGKPIRMIAAVLIDTRASLRWKQRVGGLEEVDEPFYINPRFTSHFFHLHPSLLHYF